MEQSKGLLFFVALFQEGGDGMADNFGLKIGVEGEKEFKKALREINQEFKVLGSEMKWSPRNSTSRTIPFKPLPPGVGA
jgi:hypothetical protein